VFLGIHGAASAVFRTDSEQVELLAAANAALKSDGVKGRSADGSGHIVSQWDVFVQEKETEQVARSVCLELSAFKTEQLLEAESRVIRAQDVPALQQPTQAKPTFSAVVSGESATTSHSCQDGLEVARRD
jgi:hypothetical protein